MRKAHILSQLFHSEKSCVMGEGVPISSLKTPTICVFLFIDSKMSLKEMWGRILNQTESWSSIYPISTCKPRVPEVAKITSSQVKGKKKIKMLLFWWRNLSSQKWFCHLTECIFLKCLLWDKMRKIIYNLCCSLVRKH